MTNDSDWRASSPGFWNGLDVSDRGSITRAQNQRLSQSHGIAATPKSAIDRRIAQSMEDIKQGRAYGPFDSAGEMVRSLRENVK
jgi:hypothetical protein